MALELWLSNCPFPDNRESLLETILDLPILWLLEKASKSLNFRAWRVSSGDCHRDCWRETVGKRTSPWQKCHSNSDLIESSAIHTAKIDTRSIVRQSSSTLLAQQGTVLSTLYSVVSTVLYPQGIHTEPAELSTRRQALTRQQTALINTICFLFICLFIKLAIVFKLCTGLRESLPNGTRNRTETRFTQSSPGRLSIYFRTLFNWRRHWRVTTGESKAEEWPPLRSSSTSKIERTNLHNNRLLISHRRLLKRLFTFE